MIHKGTLKKKKIFLHRFATQSNPKVTFSVGHLDFPIIHSQKDLARPSSSTSLMPCVFVQSRVVPNILKILPMTFTLLGTLYSGSAWGGGLNHPLMPCCSTTDANCYSLGTMTNLAISKYPLQFLFNLKEEVVLALRDKKKNHIPFNAPNSN